MKNKRIIAAVLASAILAAVAATVFTVSATEAAVNLVAGNSNYALSSDDGVIQYTGLLEDGINSPVYGLYQGQALLTDGQYRVGTSASPVTKTGKNGTTVCLFGLNRVYTYTFDLGGAFKLGTVAFRNVLMGANKCFNVVKVEVSSDNVEWTEVAFTKTYTAVPNAEEVNVSLDTAPPLFKKQIFNVTADFNATAAYLRVSFDTSNPGDEYYDFYINTGGDTERGSMASFDEIEVYGPDFAGFEAPAEDPAPPSEEPPEDQPPYAAYSLDCPAPLPESSHVYSSYCHDVWIMRCTAAEYITLKFSPYTYTERNYDFISVYDGDGNLCGTYSGDDLAGKSVTVYGGIVKLCLNADSSYVNYGFALSSATAYFNDRDDYANAAWAVAKINNEDVVAEDDVQKPGDVNGDGRVSSLDAAQVLKHDAMLTTLTAEALKAADVNGDGRVNSLDAAQILKYDASIISAFEKENLAPCKLTVYGKDISNDCYAAFELDTKVFQLPLLAIAKEIGISIEWVSDTKVVLSKGEKTVTLDTEAPNFGTTPPDPPYYIGIYVRKAIGGDLIMDSTSVLWTLNRLESVAMTISTVDRSLSVWYNP